MIKNILVSHNSIPTNSIGSWKRMFTDLNNYDDDIFDYIICPIENKELLTYKNIEISGYRNSRILNRLIKNYKYRNYTDALKKILKKEKQIVITIIDNYGILLAVEDFLVKIKKRDSAKIIFLQHGHNYYLSSEKKQNFFNAIDLLVLLTLSSYKKQWENVHAIPCRIEQLYNGVDSDKFNKVSIYNKKKLRKKLGLDPDKKYFLWLSQDRKKKGLHILLKVWKEIIEQNEDVELILIGTTLDYKIQKVKTIGRLPNDELPDYYKISDFYLFPTLCYEGHSLSLTEALKSGCYCIASDIGANSEILGYGNYGQLVKKPNFEESWYNAISEAISYYSENNLKNPYSSKIPENIYDLKEWLFKITKILKTEKQGLD